MSNRENKKLLFDINSAILRVEQYIGTTKKFEDYQNNTMLKQAVERNIEIIGEAMSKLLKKLPNAGITNARKIVNTGTGLFMAMMILRMQRFGLLLSTICQP